MKARVIRSQLGGSAKGVFGIYIVLFGAPGLAQLGVQSSVVGIQFERLAKLELCLARSPVPPIVQTQQEARQGRRGGQLDRSLQVAFGLGGVAQVIQRVAQVGHGLGVFRFDSHRLGQGSPGQRPGLNPNAPLAQQRRRMGGIGAGRGLLQSRAQNNGLVSYAPIRAAGRNLQVMQCAAWVLRGR